MGFLRTLFRRRRITQRNEESEPPDSVPAAVVVTDVLDLHGFFPEQVPEMIKAFLENADTLGLRTLRVIHGKGRSKLKWMVRNELKKYSHVEGYRDAPPELGGWGATVIYLKKEKKKDDS